MGEEEFPTRHLRMCILHFRCERYLRNGIHRRLILLRRKYYGEDTYFGDGGACFSVDFGKRSQPEITPPVATVKQNKGGYRIVHDVAELAGSMTCIPLLSVHTDLKTVFVNCSGKIVIRRRCVAESCDFSLLPQVYSQGG